MITRILIGAAMATVLAQAAQADSGELVTNGSFASGDFSGWTLSGDQSGAPSVGQAQGQFTGANGAPLGNAAFLGTYSGELDLTQTLNTVVGQTYVLSLDVQADQGTSYTTGAADYFASLVDGQSLASASLLNVNQQDWQVLTASFTATSTSTTLSFAVRNDPSYFELTQVSVQAVPEPDSVGLVLAGLLSVGLFSRRRKGN